MHARDSHRRHVPILHLVSALLLLALFASSSPPSVQAVSPNIVISQVYGGGGNTGAPYQNDFVELYNLSGSAVDVSGWTIQYASSAGTSWQKTTLSGTIQPGKYYLVQEAAGTSCSGDPCGVALPPPNATGSISMSATSGKVALVSNSTTLTVGCPTGLVDFVGYGTSANCSETSPTGTLSNSTAALRKQNGAQDTDNNSNDFTVGAPNPHNTPPPDAAPSVASTVPANGGSNVPLDSNLGVTFSEPVNVTGTWFTLTCTLSGAHTAAVSGGSTTFTLNPNVDLVAGDNCTFTVLKDQVHDQDTNDPPDTMTADFTATFATLSVCQLPFTPIYQVQGSGATAAITGNVTTQGVVVGDYEGASPALRGFFIQDATGDGNPATSDGIFVFESDNANRVNVGDRVAVSGTAGENQGQTQITSTSVASCGTGSVAPTNVTLPVPSLDNLERYEGMLVRFSQTLFVTEHYQLGRFDQVVMSSGARLKQPTNVTTPGAAALALQAQNDLNRIIVDDGLNNQNPDPILFGRGGLALSASNTLRGADTVTNLVGVLTYTWSGNSASGNAYRLRPVNALGSGVPNFQPANPRPGAPSIANATLKVVSMNLLNFFNTFGTGACTNGADGTATDCRGAESQAEFDRQWPKTVSAMVGTGADIIGVNEIENDGYGPTSAIQFLVDKLNAATAPGTYAFIDVDARTGQVNALGTDAIKVGLIYKPAKVTPTGKTAALNSVAFVNGGDSGPRNRPSLAQAFQQRSNNARFVVDLNHLKSKGSACDAPDAGDGQGNCNLVRTNAAKTLATWLASDPTGIGDPDVLILGDLNSYAKEDPITALTNAGYTNLVNRLIGTDAYSYVFDGQWGYLDHALASASLNASQVAGMVEWHINADEPSVLDYNTNFKTTNLQNTLYAPDSFRISDHDPVVVGLNLDGIPPTLTVAVSPQQLWPPDHQQVTVNATVNVSDNLDSHPTFTLVSVTSNEPDNGLGDGDQPNDIVKVSPTSFKVRAERSGTGTGRVYSITYKATDAFGNSTVATVTVTVPRDMGAQK